MVLVLAILISCAAVAMYLLYLYLTRNFRYWEKHGVPFLKPTPGFGNMGPVLRLQKSIGFHIADLHKKTKGPYVGIFNFDKPALLIRDPEIIKYIMVKDFNHFTNRSFASDKHVAPLQSQGVFGLRGERWRKVRVKLTPSFTTIKMKNMFHLVKNCAENMKSIFESHNDKIIDVKDVFARYTTDVITTCAFGLQGKALEDPNWEFRQIVKNLFSPNFIDGMKTALMFVAPKILRLFRVRLLKKEILSTVRNAIWTTVDLRKKNSIVRNDFIDLLLDIQKQTIAEHEKDPSVEIFDGDLFVAQAFGFLIAGSEASSTNISLALYELALQPDIQNKIREEINRVFDKHNGELTYESLQELVYLSQVVNETLRKYPSLPFLDRICVQEYHVPGTNLIIEKDTTVFVSAISLQNDPEVFPNPEKFDPDRFTEENMKKIPKFTYMPFGEGPRNCIGMRFGLIQSKIGIIYLLKNYFVEVCKETPTPLKFDHKNFALTTLGGIPLKLKKISF